MLYLYLVRNRTVQITCHRISKCYRLTLVEIVLEQTLHTSFILVSFLLNMMSCRTISRKFPSSVSQHQLPIIYSLCTTQKYAFKYSLCSLISFPQNFSKMHSCRFQVVTCDLTEADGPHPQVYSYRKLDPSSTYEIFISSYLNIY